LCRTRWFDVSQESAGTFACDADAAFLTLPAATEPEDVAIGRSRMSYGKEILG
jgi:hypothetical protein